MNYKLPTIEKVKKELKEEFAKYYCNDIEKITRTEKLLELGVWILSEPEYPFAIHPSIYKLAKRIARLYLEEVKIRTDIHNDFVANLLK